MPTYLERLIIESLSEAYRAVRPDGPTVTIEVRPSDRPEFGDYSSNLALIASRSAGIPPRELAERLMKAVGGPFRVEVAGPGFLNFFLARPTIHAALSEALSRSDRFGFIDEGEGKRAQIEFVSSNPTGPLTVGHGRQAVLGDVLSALYERLGYDVEREYYFNDEGRQIDLLAESLWVRFRELHGESRPIPEGGYEGDYLREMAKDLRAETEEEFSEFDPPTRERFRREAVSRITEWIKEDLAKLGVRFDTWFSEADLHRAGKVEEALVELEKRGGVYEKDGAVWLAAERHGGAKDSVLIRSDGRPTYLMVDIAYHIDKFRRGFSRVIDVQGSDHQVEQSCVKAALRILDFPDDFLSYAVHQFVSLKEKGEIKRMSTRAGRFFTLRALIDELGRDVVRYFMISRRPEAHLEFDLDLARSESLDNPATYVKYAHTRIASIFRKAAGMKIDHAGADLSLLAEEEELELIKKIDRFPEVIRVAAVSFAPHMLAEYALDLARSFHAYYDKHRVLGDDIELSRARLSLLSAIKLVLKGTLDILGMDAPEEM
ncbi:arginine--tRNA ligase [Candidatus Acetothermia bacterium]|nr:MAG: arginine--tRNA ligase [Candidatus Acetothermia bacterium]